jgi:hypothetical protein
MKMSQSLLLALVSLLGCASLRLDAQGAGSCAPVTPTSTSVRNDLAAKASDPSAAGDTARALYHIPFTSSQTVAQVLTDNLCERAISSIRASRSDGAAPTRVALFRVGNVYVVTGESGTPFTGTMWTFDQSLVKFLGGVLQ